MPIVLLACPDKRLSKRLEPALARLADLTHDYILVDIALLGTAPRPAIQQLRTVSPATRTVVISSIADIPRFADTLRENWISIHRKRGAESSHPFALHPTPEIEHEHVGQSVVWRPIRSAVDSDSTCIIAWPARHALSQARCARGFASLRVRDDRAALCARAPLRRPLPSAALAQHP